jgi:hypothetical protein
MVREGGDEGDEASRASSTETKTEGERSTAAYTAWRYQQVTILSRSHHACDTGLTM